jgi:hypothetical protein
MIRGCTKSGGIFGYIFQRTLGSRMFPVFDLSASIADCPEALGSKEKLWLTPEAPLGLGNDLHLFKVGRAGTGENWAEKAACEIAKALGLPCAEYHLADTQHRAREGPVDRVPNRMPRRDSAKSAGARLRLPA